VSGTLSRDKLARCAIAVLVLASASVAGCRSDPGCERAISMLRAEKLDLEDRYYELEAKYRMLTGADAPPGGWVIEQNQFAAPRSTTEPRAVEDNSDDLDEPLEIEIPESNEPPDALPLPGDGPIRRQSATGESPAPASQASLARFITEVTAVGALEPPADEAAGSRVHLIIQPLDDEGAVLPLAGMLRIRLLGRGDDGSEQELGRWQFVAAQTAALVEIDPQGVPGIHLNLDGPGGEYSSLRAEIGYLTLDRRLLRTACELSSEPLAVAEPTLASPETRPADPESGDAPPATAERPVWKPTRE